MAKMRSASYTPKPQEFPQTRIIKTMGPQKGHVISRFQFWWFWGKKESAYYTPKHQEFLKIRIIKTMGPKKRTSNKQISILVVLGQNAICLLHRQTPGISSNKDHQRHAAKKGPLISRFQFWWFWAKMQSAYYTPKPEEFPQIRIIKAMGPQKRPVISRFQFWGVWAKMQSAYYTPKPQEFPQIRIIKAMGPQKRTCDKQISILGVVGQNAICLLHRQIPGISSNKDHQSHVEFGGGVINRFTKWGVISKFFWMTAVMSNLLICWHWRISAYYLSVTIDIPWKSTTISKTVVSFGWW